MKETQPATAFDKNIADTSEAVGLAIQRAQNYLLSIQYPEGYWWAELETNVTMAAEYLLLTHFLGTADRRRWDKIVNYLRRQQLPDGTWDEPHFTATGFPRDFFINYHMYRNYFPLMALGRYQGLSTGSL